MKVSGSPINTAATKIWKPSNSWNTWTPSSPGEPHPHQCQYCFSQLYTKPLSGRCLFNHSRSSLYFIRARIIWHLRNNNHTWNFWDESCVLSCLLWKLWSCFRQILLWYPFQRKSTHTRYSFFLYKYREERSWFLSLRRTFKSCYWNSRTASHFTFGIHLALRKRSSYIPGPAKDCSWLFFFFTTIWAHKIRCRAFYGR